MHRRTLLTQTALAGLAAMVAPGCAARAPASGPVGGPLRRVRPSDPEWPDAAAWERLRQRTGGRLVRVQSPLAECVRSLQAEACQEFSRRVKNP